MIQKKKLDKSTAIIGAVRFNQQRIFIGPKTFNLLNENLNIFRKVDGTVCEYNFNQYLRWGMKMVIKKEKWNEIDIKYFVAT